MHIIMLIIIIYSLSRLNWNNLFSNKCECNKSYHNISYNIRSATKDEIFDPETFSISCKKHWDEDVVKKCTLKIDNYKIQMRMYDTFYCIILTIYLMCIVQNQSLL